MLQRYRDRGQVGLSREGDSSYSGPTPQSLGVCAAFSIKLASTDVSDSISLSQAVEVRFKGM